MGGLGSGRWKDRARKTVESYLMLDVNQLSEKGWLALTSDSRIWSVWCAKRNISPLPAEPTAVVAFVDAHAEIKSPATVRRYIATIAQMHRAAELTDPTKAEAVRLAVKRLTRAKGSRQRQAAPLGELAAGRLPCRGPRCAACRARQCRLHHGGRRPPQSREAALKSSTSSRCCAPANDDPAAHSTTSTIHKAPKIATT
jgi:hypothetical protein